jgi:septal ring factor EnvC (AmiA/AmiB activator)
MLTSGEPGATKGCMPPQEVSYKDLTELSTHITNIIKGMSALLNRIKGIEESNKEIYTSLKGLADNQQQLFEAIKKKQAEIKELNAAKHNHVDKLNC